MARYERQNPSDIRLQLELVFGGVGQTGLAATTFFVLQRISDGKYWNDGTSLWEAVPPVGNTMAEVSAVIHPGLYEYQLPNAGIDLVASEEGFRFLVSEATVSVHESGFIATTAWRLLAIRQRNMRFVPTAWDPTTQQPTAGEVFIYGTKAQLLADTGPAWAGALGRYSVTASFNGSGQLLEYFSVQDL